MEDALILSRILNDSRYTFRVGDMIVPRKILSRSSDRVLDLHDFREDQLGSQSIYSKNFLEDISGEDFVQELPIPIENTNLWDSLVVGSSLDPSYKNRSYFMLDYYFPKGGVIVEIDSSLHNIEYDRVRDLYFSLYYGVKTIRLFEYGESDDDRYLMLSSVKNFLSSNSFRRIGFDFTRTILDYFHKKNSERERVLDEISPILFKSIIDQEKELLLTEKDIGLIESPGDVKLFIESFFPIKVYIALGVKSKSIYEIKKIVSSSNKFKWSSMVGKSVPSWLTYIMGDIPDRFRNRINIEKDKYEDSGVYRLLEKLRRLKNP